MESSSTDKAISPPPNAQTEVLAVELPPRSFFDSDSESEGEPVLSRASTVRAQRPRLVEHNINAGGRSLRIYGGSFAPSTHPDPAFSKAQQFLGPLANPDETKLGPSISQAQQLLDIPLKNLADLTPAEGENPLQSPGGPAKALEALTANAWDRASTTALAPTPPSQSDQSCTPTSTAEIPNTLANSEALGTLPSSTGTLRVPCRHANLPPKVSDDHSNFSRQPEVLATNGLRSNPIRDSDISGLHRAISAPPPHRQVTIRPLDLETADRHRLRQSVVSTPYPTKADRLAVRDTSPVSAAASARLSKARSPTSEERDRFPSPARPELLYLELAVARHHSMTTLVQIEVEDRSRYDDEALFKVIRKSYSQTLLGQGRYLVTAWAIRSVTFTDPIFDASNFLQHLASPKLGYKRKTWLIWLREHQVTPNAGSSSNRSENGVSLSSPISTPRMPFFKMHKTHPRVSFHFEFSLVRIALAVMGIMMLSGLAVILWVLFGVPGSRLAQAQHTLAMPVEKWQFDAQRRVLTGLVLGVLVALLGTMGGVGWIVASWLLL